MIKNERQYKITKAQAAKFESTLADLERQARPSSIDPLLWRAQLDAVRSQYEELGEELQEYEALLQTRPSQLEAGSLDDLPKILIQARIALDLSQKDLANRMGLKEQQIQRYEASNYSSATLSRLMEVAEAMGVRISERAYLPQNALNKDVLIDRIESCGIDYEFLTDRLLPSDLAEKFDELSGDADAFAVRSVSNILERIYGWTTDDLCSSRQLQIPIESFASARFKIPEGRRGESLQAYVGYAHYLAIVVANAIESSSMADLSLDSKSIHHALVRDGDSRSIDFSAILDFVWKIGIPVLPLSDAGNFHGACWRIRGQNVIVLKQRSAYASRWAFDLLHELHHAIQNPGDATHGWVEGGDLESLDRKSPEEQAANLFAANILLEGRAEELVAECVRQAKKSIPRLKGSVVAVASEGKVGSDHLANYLAYRLSLQGVNWWGTAANLQGESANPISVARQTFFERFDFARLNRVDAKILSRALAEGDT